MASPWRRQRGAPDEPMVPLPAPDERMVPLPSHLCFIRVRVLFLLYTSTAFPYKESSIDDTSQELQVRERRAWDGQ